MSPTPLVAASPYAKLGGEAGVRRLVHRFYELMDELPEAWAVRRAHPGDLAEREQRLFTFLCGWLGGPVVGECTRAHPSTKPARMPGCTDRQICDEWLLCMRLALAEQVPDPNFRAALQLAFEHMASQLIGDGLG